MFIQTRKQSSGDAPAVTTQQQPEGEDQVCKTSLVHVIGNRSNVHIIGFVLLCAIKLFQPLLEMANPVIQQRHHPLMTVQTLQTIEAPIITRGTSPEPTTPQPTEPNPQHTTASTQPVTPVLSR